MKCFHTNIQAGAVLTSPSSALGECFCVSSSGLEHKVLDVLEKSG
jgi:hypothetical protein